MKKFLFAAVTTCALLTLIPTAALAKHNHRAHHRAHARHTRVRHQHFGTASSSPGSASSSPGPGSTQGEGSQPTGGQPPAGTSSEAGTVQSFHNGILTLMLRDGSTVTGQVTTVTEMECEAADPNEGQDQAENGDHGQPSGGDQGDDRDHRAGHDQGDGQGQNDDADTEATCPAMPAQGDTVREAELSISSTGAVWQKVEFVAPQQS